MERQQEKRIVYICLLGAAAIFPIAINPWQGPYLALVAIFFVVLYIRSDQKKMKEEQRGFPIITKDDASFRTERSGETSTEPTTKPIENEEQTRAASDSVMQ